MSEYLYDEGAEFEHMSLEQLEELAADETLHPAAHEAVLFALASFAVTEAWTGVIEEGA